MKRYRQGISLLLALLLLAGMVPGFAVTAYAQEDPVIFPEEVPETAGEPVPEEIPGTNPESQEGEPAAASLGEGLTWNYDSAARKLTISGAGTMGVLGYQGQPWQPYLESIKTVVIGSGIQTISDYAFAGCTALTSVTIPESVVHIGAHAFYNCKSLTQVTLPSGLKTLENALFYHCEKLSSIRIPNGVTKIGSNVFQGTALTSITIPASVTTIGGSAFSDCTGLREISIPGSVTKINSGAFSGCTGLREVTIPTSITRVEAFLFADCTGITQVNLHSGIASIGNNAFENCIGLTEFTIPAGVAQVDGYTFSGCTNLKNVNLPDSIAYIAHYAFQGCSSLERIQIPAAVSMIEERAFASCSSLREIRFLGTAPIFGEAVFEEVTATAVYPAGDSTWTYYVMRNYGGRITWKTDTGDETPENPDDPDPEQPDPEDPDDGALPVPEMPYKITNVISGVHVYWKPVEGAEEYGIWRGTYEEGGYRLIATTPSTHFLDRTAESGVTYLYRISTYDMHTDSHSDRTDPVGIPFVGTPDLTLRVNRAVGIGLGWPRIEGARGYAVYRKSYDGGDAWKRVATIRDGDTTTWDDTSVKQNNGQIYRYTVRALTGPDLEILSGCHGNGRTMVRLTSRSLTSVTAAGSNAIKCSWGTTIQATGYEIRLMVGSSVYKTYTIGNYKTGVKTLTGLHTGRNYKVQVRSYKKVDGVGSFYSAWSAPQYVELSR